MTTTKFVTTGWASLDTALGGGWAVGRVAELRAPEAYAYRTAAAALVQSPDALVAVLAAPGTELDLALLPAERVITAEYETPAGLWDAVLEATKTRLVVAVVVVGGNLAETPRHLSRYLRGATAAAAYRDAAVVVCTPTAPPEPSSIWTPLESGNALRFYATQRVVVGDNAQARVVKNKLAAPFTTADLS